MNLAYETNQLSPKRESLLSGIEVIDNANTTIYEETYSFNGQGNIMEKRSPHAMSNEIGTKGIHIQ